MIRVGIVGCGRMGENYCHIVRDLEEISRQLLAMPDAAQARAGPAYDDKR
jgi:predicted dehydrogenase